MPEQEKTEDRNPEDRNKLGVGTARLLELQDERAEGLTLALRAQEEIERLLVHPQASVAVALRPEDVEKVRQEFEQIVSGAGTVTDSALDRFAAMKPEDHDYVDSAQHPLTYLDVSRTGQFVTVKEGPYPGIGHELTFIELGANGIASSHVSAIACDLARKEGRIHERIFVRFKGGVLYRYWPFTDGESRWSQMVSICRAMKLAQATPLTIGEYVERVLKTAHENGIVTCEKLEGDAWVTAQTKSEVGAARVAAQDAKKRAKAEAHNGPADSLPDL